MPALINAIFDALARLWISGIDLPAVPERIWAALAEPQRRQRRSMERFKRSRFGLCSNGMAAVFQPFHEIVTGLPRY